MGFRKLTSVRILIHQMSCFNVFMPNNSLLKSEKQYKGVFMSLKKSLYFAVAFSFVVVSAVNAQENANAMMLKFGEGLPENCQDAIKRFPENLRSGWERGYIAATSVGQMSDDSFLNIMHASLMANFIKTNIILKGMGNVKIKDSDVTYAQYYPQLKVGPMGVVSFFRLMTAMTGNSGGINWDKWEQDFMAFL